MAARTFNPKASILSARLILGVLGTSVVVPGISTGVGACAYILADSILAFPLAECIENFSACAVAAQQSRVVGTSIQSVAALVTGLVAGLATGDTGITGGQTRSTGANFRAVAENAIAVTGDTILNIRFDAGIADTFIDCAGIASFTAATCRNEM